MPKTIELELKRGPDETSFLSGFNKRRIKRHRGVYSIALDAREPQDRLQFRHLLRNDAIELDGFPARDLALFDPGFAEKKVEKLLGELRAERKHIPEARDEYANTSTMLAIAEQALGDNLDAGQVKALYSEVQKCKAKVEVAQIKTQTIERNIGSLEVRINAALAERRRAEFKDMREPMDVAVIEFNTAIRKAYADLWATAKDLLPRLAEVSPDAFPGQIVFVGAPLIEGREAILLRTLRSFPQIAIRKNPARYEFATLLSEDSQ